MNKILFLIYSVALSAALAATLPLAAQASKPIAVHAGQLLDVKTGKLLTDQTLIIKDGKIVSVGPSADSKVPA